MGEPVNRARLVVLFLTSTIALAGLPPTTGKISTDTGDITTFKFQFPNFTGTHTGTLLSLGVNGIAGGGTGQVTAGAAIDALLPSQGGNAGFFLQTNGVDPSWVAGGLSGTMPSAHASSTSVVTSATTTYVTAISTTITMTATSAPVYAKATATLTTTTAASVAKYRVSINGVAGQEQLLSLTATATNYTAAVQYISAALGPGTYTLLFEVARNSGAGTVNFFEGTLDAIGLQGAEDNGITQLTGALQAGPGSGSQVLSGVLPVANGGTHLSSTTINQILYSSANNVIAGLATTNTGALVTSSTGVPSLASGSTANRLLRTNGTAVSFAQANLTTDVTGTLPFANGGTGATSFPTTRIPVSNGTNFFSDASFLYDTATTRFSVGGPGSSKINAVVPSGSDLGIQSFCQGTNNCVQIRSQAAYTLAMLYANDSNATGVLVGAEKSRGTQTSRTQALSGDIGLDLVGSCYTGAASSTGFTAAIQYVQSENCTASANGGEIVFNTTPNTTTALVERLRIKQSGEVTLVNTHLKSTQTIPPTVAVQAGAGTGATCTIANATDRAGEVTITTGTLGLSTGSYCQVSFNKAYVVAPICTLTPASSTISTSVYVTRATGNINLNFAVAGGITSTYVINYQCEETQ